MMSPLTSEQQTRHDARANHARRERMRLRRQRVGLVVLLVAVAVAGTAFAFRGASPATPSAPSSRPVAGASVPTRTVESTASAETSRASKPATKTPAPAPAKTAVPAPPKRLSPAPGVKTIVVDKSDQRVALYKADGALVDSFRCASGVVYPRVGSYKVWGRAKQSWALSDDSTFFYFTKFAKSDKGNSIGFHSIPQEPDGSLVGKLGVPVSHGCVRLDKAKALFVYTWAANGTRVVVRR